MSSSSSRMEEIERIFKRYDVNGDGKISPKELGNMLGAIGGSKAVSQEEVKRIMSEMDSNGDGFIDLKEFSNFYNGTNKATNNNNSNSNSNSDGDERALRDAFDMYDKDKNGLISATELHMVFKSLGYKCSYRDCSKMIGSVDSDGDGSVNFEEFKKMMMITNNNPQTQNQHRHH